MQKSAYGLHNATSFIYLFALHAVDNFLLRGDKQVRRNLAKTAPAFTTHFDWSMNERLIYRKCIHEKDNLYTQYQQAVWYVNI
jgi:hypothetical protein